jgi:hypothetical protein
MSQPILLLCVTLVLASCTSFRRGHDTARGAQSPPAPAAARQPVALRSDAPSDIEATRALRRVILADPSLSADARHVIIFTNAGTMTLKGAVADAAERQKITTAAGALSGVHSIHDQMQVLNTKSVATGSGTVQ